MSKTTVFMNFVTDKEVGRINHLLGYSEGTKVRLDDGKGKVELYTVEATLPDEVDFIFETVLRKIYVIKDIPVEKDSPRF